jgi:hypothetical protein
MNGIDFKENLCTPPAGNGYQPKSGYKASLVKKPSLVLGFSFSAILILIRRFDWFID